MPRTKETTGKGRSRSIWRGLALVFLVGLFVLVVAWLLLPLWLGPLLEPQARKLLKENGFAVVDVRLADAGALYAEADIVALQNEHIGVFDARVSADATVRDARNQQLTNLAVRDGTIAVSIPFLIYQATQERPEPPEPLEQTIWPIDRLLLEDLTLELFFSLAGVEVRDSAPQFRVNGVLGTPPQRHFFLSLDDASGGESLELSGDYNERAESGYVTATYDMARPERWLTRLRRAGLGDHLPPMDWASDHLRVEGAVEVTKGEVTTWLAKLDWAESRVALAEQKFSASLQSLAGGANGAPGLQKAWLAAEQLLAETDSWQASIPRLTAETLDSESIAGRVDSLSLAQRGGASWELRLPGLAYTVKGPLLDDERSLNAFSGAWEMEPGPLRAHGENGSLESQLTARSGLRFAGEKLEVQAELEFAELSANAGRSYFSAKRVLARPALEQGEDAWHTRGDAEAEGLGFRQGDISFAAESLQARVKGHFGSNERFFLSAPVSAAGLDFSRKTLSIDASNFEGEYRHGSPERVAEGSLTDVVVKNGDAVTLEFSQGKVLGEFSPDQPLAVRIDAAKLTRAAFGKIEIVDGSANGAYRGEDGGDYFFQAEGKAFDGIVKVVGDGSVEPNELVLQIDLSEVALDQVAEIVPQFKGVITGRGKGSLKLTVRDGKIIPEDGHLFLAQNSEDGKLKIQQPGWLSGQPGVMQEVIEREFTFDQLLARFGGDLKAKGSDRQAVAQATAEQAAQASGLMGTLLPELALRDLRMIELDLRLHPPGSEKQITARIEGTGRVGGVPVPIVLEPNISLNVPLGEFIADIIGLQENISF